MVRTKTTFASPFSTGGGGTRFEWLVSTSFLVRLLRGEGARGLPPSATVVELRLQQATQGYPVDDVVIVGRQGTQQSLLALQVKHALRFTQNPLFCEVMGSCWRHFTSTNFDPRRDFVGIAMGDGSNIQKIRIHLQELLQWARTHSTSRSFYVQVGKFISKQQLLNDIHKALNRGARRAIDKHRLWLLLRRFVVLSFDFDNPGSRDGTDCWNALRNVLPRRTPSHAVALFDGLYGLVSRYSPAAGEIDFETIRNELMEHMPPGCAPALRTTKAILVEQVSNQLSKEKRTRKYIPDVFTAIDSVKDAARYFSNPVHFAQKPIDDFGAIDSSFLDRLHQMLRLPPLSMKLPKGIRVPGRLAEVPAQCRILRSHFERLSSEVLANYAQEKWEVLAGRIPLDTQHIFSEAKYLVRGPGYSIKRVLDDLAKNLSLMEARVFLLTARAGQGKTNFLCDFAENYLLLYRIPCLFMTGREIRSVPANELHGHIANLILGQDSRDTLEDALLSVGSLCQEANAPFVVLLDGINEHPDLGQFAVVLERAIESLLKFSFVKVVITCRTEYFSERFSSIRTSSFSDSIHEAQEIHRDMPERHSQRMVSAYLRYFKLKPSYISNNVRKALERDPLLLRFFCEAYGNPDATTIVTLPAMADVCRDVVFREYLRKKLDEVATRQPVGAGVGIPPIQTYRDVLKCIVSLMVFKSQFADIPIGAVDRSLQPALAELIAEDVFVRKDLVAGKSVLDADAEVINFTFDEFRDFLLADYLLETVHRNGGEAQFLDTLSMLTHEQCPVAEGMMRFVFYAAKRPGRQGIHALILKMPWYDTIFMQCIFSIEESCVTDADIQRIIAELSGAQGNSREIFIALIRRQDTAAFARLNIDLLFRILCELRDDAFDNLVRTIFSSSASRYGSAPREIDKFTSYVRSQVANGSAPWELRYSKLVELLVLLFSIEGSAFTYPTYSLFRDLAAQRPLETLRMLAAHTGVGPVSVRTKIWQMLTDLASQGLDMPNELVEEASQYLRGGSHNKSTVAHEMERFIVAAANRQ